jgi:hypothetical protein
LISPTDEALNCFGSEPPKSGMELMMYYLSDLYTSGSKDEWIQLSQSDIHKSDL